VPFDGSRRRTERILRTNALSGVRINLRERIWVDVLLEPLDFIARLAALVPSPRVHLTRFHGVFAAHARLRAAITPGGRGPGARKRAPTQERPPPRDIRMNWARRLKRVFCIEIEQCVRCSGRLKVIASIEEPELIERILKADDREQDAVGRFLEHDVFDLADLLPREIVDVRADGFDCADGARVSHSPWHGSYLLVETAVGMHARCQSGTREPPR
jgi:hypothetical protein